MLVDYHLPPPERPVWEPDWILCGWIVAALAATAGSFLTAGFASFVLMCAALGFGAQAAVRVLPYGDGLHDYRQ